MSSISNWILEFESVESLANKLSLSKIDEKLAETTPEKFFNCNVNEEAEHFFFVYSIQQTFKLTKRKDGRQTA